MAAYATQNAGWRVAFGLNHWWQLDQETRQQVVAELNALSLDGVRRGGARAMIGQVKDILGREQARQYDMLPSPAEKTGG